jgi:hypothetical protein
MLVLLPAMACFTMESIDVPSSGYPGECLMADLEITSDLYEYPDSGYGFCGVLLPDGWTIESMAYTGDLSGTLLPDSVCTAFLEDLYPSPMGYGWLGCRSEAIRLVHPCTLEVYAPVQTDSCCGSFWLAFQTGGASPPATEIDDYSAGGNPWYGFLVEISPDGLALETWGAIKGSWID